jgi:hypothetical protein
MDDDREWTPEERAALDALARPEALPAGGEERIVDALRGEGRLRSRTGRTAWARLAAAALLAVASFLAGRHVRDVRPSGSPLPRFALLIYADAVPLTAVEEERRVDEYRRWALGLRDRGRGISGEKLGDTRVVLGAATSAEPGGGPAIGGFFVLEAASLEEAARLARSCPHLKHGGRIEVRPIDPT